VIKTKEAVMVQVYCYAKCTTCKKALKWLDDKGVEYKEIDIKGEHPDEETLRKIYKKSDLPLRRFFNTSGMKYRELKLKDKLPDMSEDEQLDLLATDGMLVKRPILVNEDTVLVGFKVKEWEEKLL
jgi:arsenate reductase